MNNLFEFDEDFNIVITPEALAIDVFHNVWKKYKDKELFVAEMTYIVFLLHHKSDFSDIRDEEERRKVILESLYRGSEIKVDGVTEKAIEFYKSRNETVLTGFLDDAMTAIDKTRKYLRDVNYSTKDDKGNFIYKPKEVIAVIKESPALLKTLKELKIQIQKDQDLSDDVRGSGKKGVYEDG